MKKTSFKKQSDKRKKENPIYLKLCREVDRDNVDRADNIICFFCDKPICDVDDVDVKWKVDHHHLLKRDEYFLDKRFLVPSHPTCHIKDYHAVEDTDAMLSRPWFGKLLYHIKHDIPHYNKLIRRYETTYGSKPTYRGEDLEVIDANSSNSRGD